MKKHWIFDWSGTLVDDMGIVVDATNYVLQQYGKPTMERETFRKEFTLPYDLFYKRYLPDVPMEEVEACFRKGFAESDVKVTVLPYAREFLDSLKANGCKLYILSSMDEQGFEEQANVFVGDMTHDVETAHHAGVMSIGVLTGYNHAGQLGESEPTIMAKDLSVVQSMLKLSKRKPDTVKIRGLELPTFIGVPDEERADQQVLKVHVDMVPKVGFGELKDEIEGGVDYYQVSLRLKDVALEKPRKLIETLAEDLANVVLKEFSVEHVRVEIEKFILPDTQHVGVEIER